MDSIFSSIDEIREHIQYCPDSDFEYRGFKGKIKVWPDGRAAGMLYIDDLRKGPVAIDSPEDVEILHDVEMDINSTRETSDSGRYSCQV